MINNDWDIVLSSVWNSTGFKKFMEMIKSKYEESTCFPKYDDIFNALKLTPYKNVKVVILGQDPYHGTGEAHGLSFSVLDGTPKPPSLKNIFKELNNDLGYAEPISGDLTSWAKQGVLLLNSVLTVEKDKLLISAFEEITKIYTDNPNLKEIKSFDGIIKDINKNEIKLISLRTLYNKCAMEFNSICNKFPYKVICKFKKFKERTLYEGKELNDEIEKELNFVV